MFKSVRPLLAIVTTTFFFDLPSKSMSSVSSDSSIRGANFLLAAVWPSKLGSNTTETGISLLSPTFSPSLLPIYTEVCVSP